MSSMRNPQRGMLCAGARIARRTLPSRMSTRRVRGRVVCGNIGCVAVGAVQPAAATCRVARRRCSPRYRQEVPCDGTPDAPAVPLCVHVAPDTEIAADDAAERFAGLAAEGATTILAVMASSKAYLSREAIEGLGQRMLELGVDSVAVLDPFDLERCGEVLSALIAEPGITAYCSPRRAPSCCALPNRSRLRSTGSCALGASAACRSRAVPPCRSCRLCARSMLTPARVRPVLRGVPFADYLQPARPHERGRTRQRTLRRRTRLAYIE